MAGNGKPGFGPGLGRRELIKLGVGAFAASAAAPAFAAQQGADRGIAPASNRPEGLKPYTRVGWINDANRASGNGPMDDTTRQIVRYVGSFSDSILNDAVVHTVNRTMVDTMACLISGFESEPARIWRPSRTERWRGMRTSTTSVPATTPATTSPESLQLEKRFGRVART
jgi:hypothetical protein